MYNNRHMLTKRLGFALLIFCASSAVGFSQSEPAIPVEEIIKRFSEKEKEFKAARANYAYRQEVKVQELSASDRVLGEWQQTTDITFDDKGKRIEKVVFAPPSTLDRLSMTPEDLQRYREIQPFVLTSDELGKYNLKYTGKEKIDEITAYVFEVGPKKIEKGQQYFEGKIWVDDVDFQIVKTYGKAVPEIRNKNQENLFPKFETYREQIDGYWFPTYTRAVDTLDFSTGRIRMREIIRYGNYKRFGVEVKMRFGGEATADGAKPGAEPAPPPAAED